MGFVYSRGNKLWISFNARDGSRRRRPTGLDVGQENHANELLKAIDGQIAAEKAIGAPATSGPMLFREYARLWIAEREERELMSVSDDRSRLKNHILPHFGNLPLDEIRPRQVRVVVKLWARSGAAPRTVINIFSVLRTMMQDAVADEILAANPCVLKRGELPTKRDKNPEWRPTAIFSQAELQELLSNPQVPGDRRMINALMGLGCLRFGEAAALRWHHVELDYKPLGRLLVARSYSTKKKKEKGTKTDVPRHVPIHPALAALLKGWLDSGFRALYGRSPTPEDLVVPSRRWQCRSNNHGLKKFHQDLARIHLRPRRQHDLRRTFISLARAGGARKDVLQSVTHGLRQTVMDIYTEYPWELCCEEVAKLKFDMPSGLPIVLRVAPVVNWTNVLSQSLSQSGSELDKYLISGTKKWRGGRDSNPRPPA